MKTKHWVLTALACLLVTIGNATDFPKLTVNSVEAGKALVVYNATEATPLEVTLANFRGDIVFYKRTTQRKAQYEKMFDFAQMGEGKYSVCINFGNRSVGRTIEVDDGEIFVGAPQRLFEPYFKLCEDKLYIMHYNCSKKPVFAMVYSDGLFVDRVKLGRNLAVQKCLDLSEVGKGELEIVVRDFFTEHKFIAYL